MINGYKWDCHSINRAAIIDLELVFRSKKCGLWGMIDLLLEFGSFDVGDSATATRFLRPLALRISCRSREVPAKHGAGGMAVLEQFQQKNNYIQLLYILIEGSLQSNFRQYGQMKQQRWDQSEKRKSQKKDQCARKGRGVVKHCVFPICCGSGGSK